MRNFNAIVFSFLLSFGIMQANAQDTLGFQSFEASTPNEWTYTATPTGYSEAGGSDVWIDITALSSITPSDGLKFWGIQDLDNSGSGGSFYHTLDFDAIDVSGYTNSTLMFKYYTIGFDSSDKLEYIVEYDNGSTWNTTPVELEKDAQAWTLVTISIPQGSNYVRLRIQAMQNGGSDYAGIDEITLIGANGDVIPPLVDNVAIFNDSTITIAFNEAVNITAENTANYTGISGISSATRNATNDTVTLSINPAISLGTFDTLYIQNIEDLASNVMSNAYEFPFAFNNSVPNLVITEYMYNDPTGPDNYEFIELYNNSSSIIQLGGFEIIDAITFQFPNMTLNADSYMIIAKDSGNIHDFFGLNCHQWTSGSLNNSGEAIVIINTTGDTIDIVDYSDSWLGEVPDGDGPSSVLCDPNADNNLEANWTISTTFADTVVGGDTLFASPMADDNTCIGTIIKTQNTNNTNTLIYPNPTNGNINIVLNNNSDFYCVEIVSLHGQLVERRVVSNTNTMLTFDLSNVETGMYFVRIKNNNSITTHKIIVQ